MSINLLNADTLHCILSHLSTGDAITASEVCKTLHAVAIHRALARVTITRSTTLGAFHRFTLTHASDGLDGIRRLTINISAGGQTDLGDDGDDWVGVAEGSLTEILAHASSLRRLVLHKASRLLSEDVHLGTAISRLRNLTDVRLDDASEYALMVVHQLKSPLRRLALRLSDGTDCTTVFSDIYAHAGSLERIELDNLVVPPRAFDDEDISPLRWMAVRELTIRSGLVDMAFIARAFPEVRTLKTGVARGHEVFVYANLHRPTTARWTHLFCVAGTITNLHSIRIDCPVHSLEVSCILRVFGSDKKLLEVVRTANPVVLTMRLSQPSVQWLGVLECREIWYSRASKHLYRLKCVTIWTLHRDFQHEYCLFCVLPKLAKVKTLECLRLVVDEDYYAHAEGVHPPLVPLHPETVDFPQLVRRLAREVPSLQYFNLSTEEKEGPSEEEEDMIPRLWWRVVVSGDGERTFEPIGTDVGEEYAASAWLDKSGF